jgi:hypothetical protein
MYPAGCTIVVSPPCNRTRYWGVIVFAAPHDVLERTIDVRKASSRSELRGNRTMLRKVA